MNRAWKPGSEPVRAATLDGFSTAFEVSGFRRSAFHPCYGLAESTLIVCGRGERASYLDRAAAHLEAGWAYTNMLPRGQVRLRLACAWPVLIGIETLRKLRSPDVLDASQRVKVTRAEVRRIIARSVLYYLWPEKWRELFKPS
jgi:hypothetical protein